MRRMVRIIGIQWNRSYRKEDLGNRKWVEVRMGEERQKEGEGKTEVALCSGRTIY